MSTLLDIADAVVTEINTPQINENFSAWSQSFTAVRQNIPRFNASDLAAVQVTVRPRDRVSTRAGRGVMQDLIRVQVCIQRKCVSDDNSQSDPLIELGEQVQAYFDQKLPLIAQPAVVCEETSFGADNESAWMSVRNQNEILVYTGLIGLQFRVMRQGLS